MQQRLRQARQSCMQAPLCAVVSAAAIVVMALGNWWMVLTVQRHSHRTHVLPRLLRTVEVHELWLNRIDRELADHSRRISSATYQQQRYAGWSAPQVHALQRQVRELSHELQDLRADIQFGHLKGCPKEPRTRTKTMRGIPRSSESTSNAEPPLRMLAPSTQGLPPGHKPLLLATRQAGPAMTPDIKDGVIVALCARGKEEATRRVNSLRAWERNDFVQHMRMQCRMLDEDKVDVGLRERACRLLRWLHEEDLSALVEHCEAELAAGQKKDVIEQLEQQLLISDESERRGRVWESMLAVLERALRADGSVQRANEISEIRRDPKDCECRCR